MNGDCQLPEQELCGCCAGVGPETPQGITNRPSLPGIAYRAGTHDQFKASMLAALSSPQLPALAPLRTRDDSDFTIALLDAFATAADILCFYQERIVNEAYLRTAVDERSVFELARLVGYRPAPGVAASTYIAFTLSSASGSPDNVLIPAKSRVQSVPGPGQLPQVFETSIDITAQIAYNQLAPQTTMPWSLGQGSTSLWFSGSNLNLNVGDALLFVGSNTGAGDIHFVVSATPNNTTKQTLVTWDQGLGPWAVPGEMPINVYVFRKKVGLFGSQAPIASSLPSSVTNLPANTDWPFQTISNGVALDAVYPGLTPVAGGDPQLLVLHLWVLGLDLYSLYTITSAMETAPARYTLTSKCTLLGVGNNEQLLNQYYAYAFSPPELVNLFIYETRQTSAYIQNQRLTPCDQPMAVAPAENFSYQSQLQRGMLAPVQGPSLEIVGGQLLGIGQPIAVVGQRLRIQVTTGSGAKFFPDGNEAGVTVTDGQVFIVTAFPPTRRNIYRKSTLLLWITPVLQWDVVTTNGVSGMLQTLLDDFILVPAATSDPQVSEAAVITGVSVNGAINTIGFNNSLANIYDRTTVTVNANVAPATHGETMYEILGNGDSTNPALMFTLKQSPLTYVSSPSGNGAASTLQVWVNNLQWHEVDNFLAGAPTDRSFVTQANSDGTVDVQFSSGVTSARTPTGSVNLRANYRKGIGLAGMVQAGQLSQPIDRPQGLQSAMNPSAATGGADPDTADSARASAPLQVLTLNRVVSLDDYQNYALAFQGVSKALATWSWNQNARCVFITIAGANGSIVQPTDEVVSNLISALHAQGNPHVPITVASYTPVLFTVAANVQIDTDDYDATQVLAATWSALASAFSFSQRQFGQGVAQSEVIALIQQTPGVIAVELTVFCRNDQPQTGAGTAVLRAASPVAGQDGSLQPAELLLIDPASQAQIVGAQ